MTADLALIWPELILSIGGLITLGALPPPVIDELARALAVPLVMVDNWAPEQRFSSSMIRAAIPSASEMA